MEITRDNLLSLIRSGMKRDAMSIAGLEREAHVPRDTVRDFLRGKTQILRADKLQKILRILEPQRRVPISGHIGAGAEVIPIDLSREDTKDEADCPPGCDPSDVVAVRIRGDAMLPVFHDGWVVYYSRRHDLKIPSLHGGWQVPYAHAGGKGPKTQADAYVGYLGKPVVVGLADGRVLLGTLKRGTTPKTYDLVNYNAIDIRNITPLWVAKIIFIKAE